MRQILEFEIAADVQRAGGGSELEEPKEPEGYWWMRIFYERSTLQVSILTPTYRAYRNQNFWEAKV